VVGSYTRLPRVSVVLATFNGARFLPAQLESLAAQTLQPCELVVGDDGSSDHTVEIVQAFAQRVNFPVRLQRNATRLGYADNFLTTAERAEGDLLAFCDQDDVWLPTKLEIASRPLRRPRVMLSVHGALTVDEHLQPLERARFRSGILTRAILAGRLSTALGSRMVCRSELLRRLPVEPRPASLDLDRSVAPHDEWLLFIASILGEVVILPQRLILYRRHVQATSASGAPPARRRLLTDASHPPIAHTAVVAADRAAYLYESAARLPNSPVVERLSVGAKRYEALSTRLTERSRLRSQSSARSAWWQFARLASRGAYGRRRKGGLGWLWLVQDLQWLKSLGGQATSSAGNATPCDRRALPPPHKPGAAQTDHPRMLDLSPVVAGSDVTSGDRGPQG